MSNSQISFTTKSFPLVHYGNNNRCIFHFHSSQVIRHEPSRIPFSSYSAKRNDATHHQIKTDLPIRSTQRFVFRKMRLWLKRIGSKFGYYKSAEEHNHVSLPRSLKSDKFSLPSLVKLMCFKKHNEIGASTQSMCHLLNISTSPV